MTAQKGWPNPLAREVAEWELWDASDISNWEAEPLEFCVEPIIPQGGIGFMSGQPKVGKSLLAQDMGLCMANAYLEETKWLGRFLCRPARILYVAREDPARRIKERGVEILNARKQDLILPGVFLFLIRERFDLLNADHIDWLEQRIEEFKIAFLVLDVFNRMIPGLDENSARDIGLAIEAVEKLNRSHDLTILLIDHTRKPAIGQSPIQEPNPFELRGSSAKYGCADFMICLSRTKQGGRLRLYSENKDSELKLDFFLDVSPKGSPDPKFRWVGDVEHLTGERKAVGAANRQKILDTIPKAGLEGASREEICAKTGLGRSAVGDHLAALVDSGAIRREGESKNTRYCRSTDRPPVSLRPSSYSQT